MERVRGMRLVQRTGRGMRLPEVRRRHDRPPRAAGDAAQGGALVKRQQKTARAYRKMCLEQEKLRRGQRKRAAKANRLERKGTNRRTREEHEAIALAKAVSK